MESSTVTPDLTSRIEILQDYFPTPYLFIEFSILVLGVLGLLGNLFSAAILFGPSMRFHKVTVFLVCLLIWDSGTIVGCCWVTGAVNCFLFLLTGDLDLVEWLSIYTYLPVSVGMYMTGQHGSTSLTLLVAIERYIQVCKPFKGRLTISSRHSMIAVTLTTILVLFYNLPFWFQQNIIPDHRSSNGFKLEEADFVHTEFFKYFHSRIPETVINHVIPLIVLAFVTIHILQVVLRNPILPEFTDLDPIMARKKEVEDVLTNISLTIFIFTIIPNLWQILETVLQYSGVIENFHVYSGTWEGYIELFGFVLIVINASVKFIIYFMAGKQFRTDFVQFFQCKSIDV